jgi:hypothetical protein
MTLTPQQKKKLQKIARVIRDGNIAIAEYIFELEETLEKSIPAITDIVTRMKGDKGDTPTKEELLALIEPLIVIPEPVHGKDYVLTSKDRKEIAKSIKVPIVEKVIEKTEVIKEQPIIKKEVVEKIVKEVREDSTAEQIINKINQDDEFLIERRKIEGLNEAFEKLSKENNRIVGANRPLSGLLDVDVSNIAVDQALKWDGIKWIPFTPGGGFTKETPTGDVNSVNQVFTVTNEPNYVVSDGATYFDGAGYTYSSLTITMDSPPSQYIRSYS